MEKQPDLSALTEPEKDTLIITLLDVVDALRLQVRQLTEELERVKGQLGKNSQNNHFLEAVAEPDAVEHPPVRQCAACANGLGGVAAEGYEERQVFDIPAPRLEMTAHRAEQKRCQCGHLTTAAFPPEASASVQYGSRIKAVVAVCLHRYQRVPYARVEEMLESRYDTRLCEGSPFNFSRQAYENLEGAENRIKAALLQQDVLPADESGIRVEGRLHWVHNPGQCRADPLPPPPNAAKPPWRTSASCPNIRTSSCMTT